MTEKTDELMTQLDEHLAVIAAQLASAQALLRLVRQHQESQHGRPDR